MGQNATRSNQSTVPSGVVVTTLLVGTGSAASLFAAAGTGLFVDITTLLITSSTTTAQATLTDGNLSYVFNVATGSPLGINFQPSLKATNANTAWTLNMPSTMNAVAIGVTATQ